MRLVFLLAALLYVFFLFDVGVTAGRIDIGFVALPFESDLDTYAGLMAAQQEANNANAFGPNTQLNITFIPGLSLANSTAEFVSYFAANVFYGRGASYVGYVTPSYTNSDALFQIMQKFNIKKPIFGPDSPTSYMATSEAPNVVNYKAPPTFESYQTLNFAMHSYMHCTYFMIFMLNFSVIIDLASLAANGMRDLGLRVEERILFQVGNDPFLDPLNRTAIRGHFFQVPNDLPTCVIILGTAPNVVEIIEALWEDPRFDGENTFFLGTSGALRRVFNSTKFGTRAFQNLYLTVGFADFMDTTIPSVASHHLSLSSYLASNPNPPSIILSSSDTTLAALKPSYNTYQGYMTARLMIEVLRAAASDSSGQQLTGPSIIRQPYKSVFFQVNETLLGPFSNGCRKDVDFPCFCNTGGRILYTVRINGSTGEMQHIPKDDPDAFVSYSTASLGICMLDLSALDAPLNVVIPWSFAESNNRSRSSQPLFKIFRETLTSAFTYANDNGQLAGVGKLRPNFLNLTSSSTNNVSAVFAKLRARYLPLAIIGSDYATDNSGLPSLLERFEQLPLADPILTPPAAFNPNALQLLPVVADYIHLHAMFAARNWSSRPVVVFSESNEQQLLAVKSLNTFGVSPLRQVLTTSSVMQSISNDVFASTDALAKGVVLLVISENATLLSHVLSAIATSALAFPQSVVSVLLACDEQYIFDIMMSSTSSSRSSLLPPQFPVYLASSLPNWWAGNASISPTAARVKLASAALVTVTRTLQNGHTSEQLMQSVYASKTLLTGANTLGPFYSALCDDTTVEQQSVARLCPCTKGPRTFYAFAFSSQNLTPTSSSVGLSPAFTFQMKTCGVQYIPLPLPPAANFFSTQTIAGIAVGSSASFLIVCFLVCFCIARFFFRNNRDAPKDGKSVTVVFTDIQSSTNLWARLPELMAACVVEHHRVLRRCLREHHGYEVKTVGDSFMVAFVNPCDAVLFSIKAQEALLDTEWPDEVDTVYDDLQREKELLIPVATMSEVATSSSASAPYVKLWHGLRVRIGMNTGSCDVVFDDVTKGFDYYGTTVNTAARVEATVDKFS